MKKVALTGSSGLVGSRIIELLGNEFTFLPISQSQMNIVNKDEVNKSLNNIDFDLFLHLAAYTNVDEAESEQEKAHLINVEGTRNVFEVVKQLNKQFIQISTDFVFDGINPPFNESYPKNPLSVYGETKSEAEDVTDGEAMIVRISYPYRAMHDARLDFVRGIIKRMRENQPVMGIIDSTFTPTFIDDIAFGLRYLMNNYSADIFHLVGSNTLSPYSAFQQIAETFKLDSSLIHETTYDGYFKGKATRPKNCEIISTKSIPVKMSTFKDGLEKIKKQLVI
jgi:dTDP-4-dehydrorhamnose reductase